MPGEKHKPEDSVAKPRQVEVAVAQGISLAEGPPERTPSTSSRAGLPLTLHGLRSAAGGKAARLRERGPP